MFGRKRGKPTRSGAAAATSPVTDPIAGAAQYVGCVSAPGEPVYADGLAEPTACFRSDGEAGVCFLFRSSVKGSGKLYFFRDFASLWADGEPGPRAQIPTQMIAARVPHYEAALADLLTCGRGGAMLAALGGRTTGALPSGGPASRS